MKRTTVYIIGFALLAVRLGFWLRHGGVRNDLGEAHDDNVGTISKANRSDSPASPAGSSAQGAISQPPLFRSTRYPPETTAEKAMWEWWRVMEKSDPKFEWKMTIEFYGRVVDQFGAAVDAATVNLEWNVVGGTTKQVVKTAADGSFSLQGARGKMLGVNILKEGYVYTAESHKSFEYAAFFQANFHVPNRAQPVVFRLQKLTGAEPMFKYIMNAEVAAGSVPVLLDVETGKLGADGDLSFSIAAGQNWGQNGPDFSVTITAMNGAAFAFSEDEFMFNAPETGYRNAANLNRLSTEPNYNRVQPYRFYVKTRSGKYAAVTGEITIREGLSEGKAGFHAITYHNPSGSRNLEFDHRKWLNR